jgi:hypothetical protein
MVNKLLLSLSILLLLSCNQKPEEKSKDQATYQKDGSKDANYDSILMVKENAYLNEKPDAPGKLLTTISFTLKNDSGGVYKGIMIKRPLQELPLLLDPHNTVISENQVTVIIDYPLSHKGRFELQSKNGFTRTQLITEISNLYYKIYDEEEQTATVKTIPINKRTTMYNRNRTNGKYGIWGHDIADLALVDVVVYKSEGGQLVLLLNMES